MPLEESLGIITNDFDQKQYDHTDFLPSLVLPPSTPSFEGLSKSARRNRRATFNLNVARIKHKGSTVSRQVIDNVNNYFRYRHPYETEILHLKYPDSVYQKAEPIMYHPFETTSATWVDTEDGVLKMLDELKGASEIAIDLEHHDSRTYTGLVSLMQISVRDKDWIVDTLKPWRHKLQVLNEVFADPKIVKVLPKSHHSHEFKSNILDLPWCVYGYCMASKRSRALRCWTI